VLLAEACTLVYSRDEYEAGGEVAIDAGRRDARQDVDEAGELQPPDGAALDAGFDATLPPCPYEIKPVYLLTRRDKLTLIYTASPDEAIALSGGLEPGKPDDAEHEYVNGGVIFSVPREPATGAPSVPSAVAVLRLYNSTTGDRLYTTDPTEAAIAKNDGWGADEGVAFYAEQAQQNAEDVDGSCTVPVEGFTQGGKHVLVPATLQEFRAQVVDAGWTSEGTRFRASPPSRQ
jgi:hypothetical protein